MANLVKPPAFQSYEYDPTYWDRLGLPSPVLFMPMRGPGRKGGVNDESGHGNDGTLNSGASWVTTANGMSLKFTGGTTNGVTVNVPVPSSWSWFAWINPATAVNLYGNLFGHMTNSGFWVWENGARLDYFDGSSTPDHPANTTFVIGAWQMIGATYTPTTQVVGTLQFYYNGLSDGSYSANQLVSPVTGIGQDNGIGGYEGYAGSIGQEIFLPAALTPAQVQQLYRNPWGMFKAPPKRFSSTRFPSIYNQTGSGGALGGGTATVDVIYNPTASSDALGGGADVTSATYNPTASGGALAGGDAVIAVTYQPIASGGAVTNGTYAGGYLYPQIASGGMVANGTVRSAYQPYFFQVASCPNGQKCGFSDDDQFCADELLVQSYGSKFVGVQRRNPSAYQLDPKKSANGSAAMVPAITLCRQKIRLRPQDQRPHRIIR